MFMSAHSLRGSGGSARPRKDLLTIKVALTVYGEVQLLDSAPESVKKRKWDSFGQSDSAAGSQQNNRASQSASSALSKDLLKLFSDDAFSDVKIITSNKQKIKAHKLVLSARSDVFKTMLCGQMSESQNNEILMIDFEPAIVRAFVRYLYEDTLAEDVLQDGVVDLYAMARKYHVVGLESLCEQFMSREMDGSNVFSLLDLAELHDSPTLRIHCLNYISEKSFSLVLEKAFMDHLDAYLLRRESPAAAPAPAPAPSTPPSSTRAPVQAASPVAAHAHASSSTAEANQGKKKKQKTSDSKAGVSSTAAHTTAPTHATSSSSSSTAAVAVKSPVRASRSGNSNATESEAEALRTRRRRDLLMVLGGVLVSDLPSLSAAERAAIVSIDSAFTMSPRSAAKAPTHPAERYPPEAPSPPIGPLTIGPGTCTCTECVAERRASRISSAMATAAAFTANNPPPGFCSSCRTVHAGHHGDGVVMGDDDEDEDDEDFDDDEFDDEEDSYGDFNEDDEDEDEDEDEDDY